MWGVYLFIFTVDYSEHLFDNCITKRRQAMKNELLNYIQTIDNERILCYLYMFVKDFNESHSVAQKDELLSECATSVRE